MTTTLLFQWARPAVAGGRVSHGMASITDLAAQGFVLSSASLRYPGAVLMRLEEPLLALSPPGSILPDRPQAEGGCL